MSVTYKTIDGAGWQWAKITSTQQLPMSLHVHLIDAIRWAWVYFHSESPVVKKFTSRGHKRLRSLVQVRYTSESMTAKNRAKLASRKKRISQLAGVGTFRY